MAAIRYARVLYEVGVPKEAVQKTREIFEEVPQLHEIFANPTIELQKKMILETLQYPARQVELAKIAGFLHDIGNVINRNDHAQSGAVMAFRLLDRLEMPVDEICSIISAIGNHDEGTAQPVDAISAALIIADKTDVRRSRVRNTDFMTFDIHDRVNYAVEYSNLHFSDDQKSIVLDLTIDTEISSVLEYFEIFMERMLLSKRAALFFDKKFKMYINGSNIL